MIWKKLKKSERLKQSDMDILIDFIFPAVLGLTVLVLGINFAYAGEWSRAILCGFLVGVSVAALISNINSAIDRRDL